MNGLVSFRLCSLSNEELVDKVDQAIDKMYQEGKFLCAIYLLDPMKTLTSLRVS